MPAPRAGSFAKGIIYMRLKTFLVVAAVLVLATGSASAQEEPGDPSAPADVSAPAEATAPAEPSDPTDDSAPAVPAASDGGRFRFGIDGTVGLESVSFDQGSISGTMFGLNLRLGWQINHMLAIYAQPHLSFGSLSTDVAGASFSGGTGTFIGTVMAEATFIDQLFAGAGFGYGVLNNPSGPVIQLRAGGYPLMGRGDNGIRRKGLMLGLDFRMVFIDQATGMLIMGAIGYEAF